MNKGGEVKMDFDDFEDFDWEDGVIIGGFFDYMVDQDETDERRRKKKQRDPDYDPLYNPDDEEPYP